MQICFKDNYEESTQYLWETILFDLQTLSPVYTVQTKTFDPSSLREMGHEHGKLIVSKMLKDKILSSDHPKPETPKVF